MSLISRKSSMVALAASIALSLPAAAAAQQEEIASRDVLTTVYGAPPADLEGLPEGPKVEGFISARNGDRLQVTDETGNSTVVRLSAGTDIRSKGGFLGLSRSSLTSDALMNGLPVTVETVQWSDNLLAQRVRFRNTDLKTASMIRTGTAQGFAEQTAATEALRGRVGDIDKYNIKGTTNVYFDTGKWRLTPDAKSDLCMAASQANSMDNALLLVVGYTDSVGDYEYNQVLSERRAGKVVNHLQQACGWKPWRMLTPTGMSEADPAADNSTPEGKAQNRRVAVNILVSKSVDGL